MITLNKNILESKSVEYIEYEGLLSDFIMNDIYRELSEGYVIQTVCNDSVIDFYKEDFEISEGDDIQISISPAATAVVGFVINLAISFAIAWLLKKLTEPDMDGIKDKGGELYQISINSMEMKPDAVIKEIFGTFLTYPDLIAAPYKRYEDGEEVTFLTTVLGVGEYSIDEMYLNGEKAGNIILNSVRYSNTVNRISETMIDAFDTIIEDGFNPNSNVNGGTVDFGSDSEISTYFNPNADIQGAIDERNAGMGTTGNSRMMKSTIGGSSNGSNGVSMTSSHGSSGHRVTMGGTAHEGGLGDFWESISETIQETVKHLNETHINPNICDGYANNGVMECLNVKQDNLNIVKLDGYVNSISQLGDVRFNNYRYLVHELVDFKDFSLIDFDRTQYVKANPDDEEGEHFQLTDALTKSSRLDYKFPIDSFEVDISTPDGIYRITEGGAFDGPESKPTTIEFDIFCYQLNDQGIQVNEQFFHWEKKLETGKKQRWTEKYNLPNGSGWYIQFRNGTIPGDLTDQIVNNFTIDRVKGLSSTSVVGTQGLTYLIFRIKTGEVFKSNTNLKIGIKATRRGLTRMNDVVNYIWKSSGYNFLELANTNELLSKYQVHGAMDASAPLYEQINRVLRAQELYLIPTISGFKVREDLIRHNLTYNFDKANIIKDSIDISYINYNKAINDGYKAIYIDYLGEKQEEVYPYNAYHPKEQIIFGIRDQAIARRRARIGYQRMIGQSKTIKIKTEKEGYIPELGDKIGITENHISDTFVSNQIGYNGNVIHLDKEILLKGNDYVSIKSELEDSEVRRKVLTAPGYTRKIVIEGYRPNHHKTAFVIGVERELYRHYLVKEINPSDTGELEITCLIYNERVYS